MLSTCRLSIVTCGSILWFIFNLVAIFVNFVQFSLNFHYFCSIQSQFCLYPKLPNLFFFINVILKKNLVKFKFILNISFIIFIPNLTIFLEGNYYICLIFGTC